MNSQTASSRSITCNMSIRAGLTATMLAIVPVACVPLSGCAASYSGPAANGSYDRVEERVKVNLLTWDQVEQLELNRKNELKSVVAELKKYEDAWTEEKLETQQKTFVAAAPFAGTAVTAVAGWVYDRWTERLEKEAEKYEAQYEATRFHDGWFTEFNKPAFNVIEVVRETKGGKPAMRLLIALVRSKSDPRIYQLRVLYVQVKSPRAKVADGSSVTLDVDMQIQGAWYGANQQWNDVALAQTRFTLPSQKWGQSELATVFGVEKNGTATPESIEAMEISGWYRSPTPVVLDVRSLDSEGAVKGANANEQNVDAKSAEVSRVVLDEPSGTSEWLVTRIKQFTATNDNVTEPLKATSESANGSASAGNKLGTQAKGVARITVLVTERDTSNARDVLEWTSSLMRQNREKVIDAVRGK